MTIKFKASLKPLVQREFDTSETRRLLTSGINFNKFICWGVSKSYNLENKGLLLKVNARRHKSYVFIVLAWDDTYTVHLISTHGNVLKSFNDVYFDMLTDVIDNEIEWIPQYKD